MRILQRMKQLWYYFIPLYIVRYFRSEGGTVFARVLN